MSKASDFIKNLKRAKVEMAENDDDIIGCEIVICMPADDGKPLLIPDNIMDFCAYCGRKVQLRPDVPPGPKRCCYDCAGKIVFEEPPTILVRPHQFDALKKFIKK